MNKKVLALLGLGMLVCSLTVFAEAAATEYVVQSVTGKVEREVNYRNGKQDGHAVDEQQGRERSPERREPEPLGVEQCREQRKRGRKQEVVAAGRADLRREQARRGLLGQQQEFEREIARQVARPQQQKESRAEEQVH